MKLFLSGLLLFLIPLILLIGGLEIYLSNLSTSYTLKKNGLLNNSKKIELLIVGNSHQSYDIDPNQFKLEAYNVAQVNQSLYYDKRITLKYIDQLYRLKYIIIGVDFHSLYFSSQGGRDIWSYYEYGISYKNELPVLSKLLRIKGYSTKAIKSIIKKDWSKKYSKVAIDVENGVNLDEPISKGWFAFAGTDESLMTPEFIKYRANQFNNMVKYSNERTEIVKDLEDFIYQLQARKITPILVTTPYYEEYKKFLDKTQLKQNEFDLNNLSKKYNIQYWNYFDLPMNRSDFYNCDHLNKCGALAFSKILSQRFEQSFPPANLFSIPLHADGSSAVLPLQQGLLPGQCVGQGPLRTTEQRTYSTRRNSNRRKRSSEVKS
jgi:hypothetical protein